MRDECERTLQRAYLNLDRELLSEGERIDIQKQLEACSPCHERYGLEREITALVARLRGHQRCPDHVRIRISALLR